jgi:hypothetical protein
MAGPLENILQAYVASNANRHAQEQEQLQREQLQESHDFHQKQLDQVYKVHKEANDVQMQQMGLHKALVGMQLTNMLNEHFGSPDQAPLFANQPSPVETGLPNTGQPDSGQPSGNVQTQPWNMKPPGSEGAFPGGFTIDPGYVAREAKNKADAYAQMTEPLLKRQQEISDINEARQTNLQDKKDEDNFKKSLLLEQARGNNNARTASIAGQYRVSAAQVRAKIAGAAEDEDDPDLAEGVFSGKIPTNILSKSQKLSVSNIAAKTGYVIPDKKVSDTLGNVTAIDALMNHYKDVIAKYSRDQPGGTNLAGITGGLIGGVVPGGDVAGELDNLKAQGGRLATFFDQQNRKSDAEILRQVTGLFDPRLTKEQNMRNFNSHLSTFNGAIKGAFHGMPPEQADKILAGSGVTNFGGMSGGDTVNLQAPDGTIKPVPKNQVDHFVKLGAKVVQ